MPRPMIKPVKQAAIIGSFASYLFPFLFYIGYERPLLGSLVSNLFSFQLVLVMDYGLSLTLVAHRLQNW